MGYRISRGTIAACAVVVAAVSLAWAARGLSVVFAAPTPQTAADKRQDRKQAKIATRELQRALQLLKRGRYDDGVDALQEIEEKYAEAGPITSKASERAKDLLIQYGASKEVRIELRDRKTLRSRLEITEPDLQSESQELLVAIRKSFKGLPAFFKESRVKIVVYDSLPRYRKETGHVYYHAHFQEEETDLKARTSRGVVHYPLPARSLNKHDRKLRLRSVFAHELAHYVNASYFPGVPSIVNEGVATYLHTRLVTDFYQGYRITEQQSMEKEARDALNKVAKLKDFQQFLKSKRGFGRSGADAVTPWYGICYALVDFCARGKVGDRSGSLDVLLKALSRMCTSHAERYEKRKRVPQLAATPICEQLVREVFDADLKTFHKSFVKFILDNYRQR